MSKNNADDIDHLLDNLQTDVPAIRPNFLDQLEDRALSFASLRVKYGLPALIAFGLLLASLIVITAVGINSSLSNNTQSTETASEYDLIPSKTLYDE